MKSKKKNSKKLSVAKYINLGVLALGFILVILGIFIENVAIPFKVFGVILMAIVGIIYAVKAKEHALFKSVGVLMLAALLLTWLLPYGYFSQTTFTDYGMNRVGLNDLPTVIYYALYFCMDKIIYLFILAGFYSLLSKTKGYQKLINDIANKLKDHEKAFAIVSIIVFVLLTSLLSQSLIVLFFVPFVISIMAKLKFDKLTTFITTFGAVLVGLVGAPWGTEGLYWFNYYASTTIQDGFWYRFIIEAVGTILFAVFALLRLKKLKKTDNEEVIEDMYEIEKTDNKAKVLPICIILGLTVVFILLGYISWNTNFGVTIFDDFHSWLTGLTIGSDVTIFSYILGKAAVAFGSWDIVTSIALMIVMSIIIALVYRIKFNEVISAYTEGFKKIAKPILLYFMVFIVFVLAYTSPFMVTFTNWAYGLTSSMNPYIITVTSFITSVFHVDLGYTGYIVGPYLTSGFETSLGIVHTIYIALYGLVQVFVPTSGILLLGLTITKVEYKTWLKYIWMFVVGMLVILLVLFTVITYI